MLALTNFFQSNGENRDVRGTKKDQQGREDLENQRDHNMEIITTEFESINTSAKFLIQKEA